MRTATAILFNSGQEYGGEELRGNEAGAGPIKCSQSQIGGEFQCPAKTGSPGTRFLLQGNGELLNVLGAECSMPWK